MKKITIHTPETHTNIILDTINQSGAGVIRNYDYCSFITKGIGTFRPLKGSSPAVGESDKINFVPEDKIELVCPDELLETVISDIKKVHPYEEMAYDVTEIGK